MSMRNSGPWISFASVAAVALAGCGGSNKPAPLPPEAGTSTAPAAAPATDATPADATAPAAAGDLAAMIASADLNKGKTLFLQCRACHSLSAANEPGKIGPTLYGVVGRPAGAVADFQYSDAVKNSGLTWTAENISAWLERPSEFLPGNKMVFIGVKEAQDRANVIAYIQAESAKPQ
jgi:cytochrome c